MSSLALSERLPIHPVFHPDGDTMFDPKWFVIGFAVAAVVLIANYDIRFGVAASIPLVAVGGIWFALSVWLAPERGAPRSERQALFNRFSLLARNRSAARTKELGSKRGPQAGQDSGAVRQSSRLRDNTIET